MGVPRALPHEPRGRLPAALLRARLRRCPADRRLGRRRLGVRPGRLPRLHPAALQHPGVGLPARRRRHRRRRLWIRAGVGTEGRRRHGDHAGAPRAGVAPHPARARGLPVAPRPRRSAPGAPRPDALRRPAARRPALRSLRDDLLAGPRREGSQAPLLPGASLRRRLLGPEAGGPRPGSRPRGHGPPGAALGLLPRAPPPRHDAPRERLCRCC
mmetsp:Transcript_8409/g.20166  ORF Transcript_8409/g.20166 Transcript_8409/m.20166 type:complete len:213 (-) Transcript_8409:1019-1657(-)